MQSQAERSERAAKVEVNEGKKSQGADLAGVTNHDVFDPAHKFVGPPGH